MGRSSAATWCCRAGAQVSLEGQLLDQKSLRAVTGKTADWNEIAKDCIAFANASGGRLLLGIEDGQDVPPSGQQIPADLPDTVRRKLAELIVEDVGRYPGTKMGDIHQRVGVEIPRSRVRRAVEQLVKEGRLCQEGVRSGTRYRLP